MMLILFTVRCLSHCYHMSAVFLFCLTCARITRRQIPQNTATKMPINLDPTHTHKQIFYDFLNENRFVRF